MPVTCSSARPVKTFDARDLREISRVRLAVGTGGAAAVWGAATAAVAPNIMGDMAPDLVSVSFAQPANEQAKPAKMMTRIIISPSSLDPSQNARRLWVQDDGVKTVSDVLPVRVLELTPSE
jgi:hypothetical protein